MAATITHSQLAGPSDEPLLTETIGRIFDRTAEKYPEVEALVVCHQGIRWNYKEYQREVDRLACGLLALGIEPGDRVSIWAPNCYEWCLTQFATAKIGAIMVCINPAYRLYELEYALNKVQCKAIIAAESFKSSDYLGMLREILNFDFGDMEKVIDRIEQFRSRIRKYEEQSGEKVTENVRQAAFQAPE